MNDKLYILNKLDLLLITIEILNTNKYSNINTIKLKFINKTNMRLSNNQYFYYYPLYIIKKIYYIYITIKKFIQNNTLKLILQDYNNKIQGNTIKQYLKKYIYIYYQYYDYIYFQNQEDIIKAAIFNLYLILKIKNSHKPYLSFQYLLIK